MGVAADAPIMASSHGDGDARLRDFGHGDVGAARVNRRPVRHHWQ